MIFFGTEEGQYALNRWVDIEFDIDVFLNKFDSLGQVDASVDSVDKNKAFLQFESVANGNRSIFIYEIKAVKTTA